MQECSYGLAAVSFMTSERLRSAGLSAEASVITSAVTSLDCSVVMSLVLSAVRLTVTSLDCYLLCPSLLGSVTGRSPIGAYIAGSLVSSSGQSPLDRSPVGHRSAVASLVQSAVRSAVTEVVGDLIGDSSVLAKYAENENSGARAKRGSSTGR